MTPPPEQEYRFIKARQGAGRVQGSALRFPHRESPLGFAGGDVRLHIWGV